MYTGRSYSPSETTSVAVVPSSFPLGRHPRSPPSAFENEFVFEPTRSKQIRLDQFSSFPPFSSALSSPDASPATSSQTSSPADQYNFGGSSFDGIFEDSKADLAYLHNAMQQQQPQHQMRSLATGLSTTAPPMKQDYSLIIHQEPEQVSYQFCIQNLSADNTNSWHYACVHWCKCCFSSSTTVLDTRPKE